MKKFMRQFHMYATILFLPVALLYALTGILALFEYEGDLRIIPDQIKYSKKPDILESEMIALKYLEEKHLLFPNYSFQVIKNGNGIAIGGLAHQVIFIFGNGAFNVFQIERKGVIAYLMALHFGQGKWYFDALGIAFGVCLGLFYLSGLLMIHTTKHKTPLIFTFILGCLVSVVMGYLSGH
ncbi:hypothetical protein BKH46_03560 [Helicobacter sp. 12S02634-8]|uniref:hypothetical protein n=1 Tax=Helicobacter sp. 12S02634-8 TaxID=1476199 RepID=UPI000BA5E808|nr:hypothetical protein [Helicobacter sp. 12S02634-8]PAF47516.1 hypothetical protein BKH46_03560 [Helicobacter sp. 12S02634-8]